MVTSRVVEYVFFFGLLGLVGYLVWQIVSPFVSALALAAIIVTISYPLYVKIENKIPGRNGTISSLVTTLIVLMIVILPFLFISSSLLGEATSIYKTVNDQQTETFTEAFNTVENTLKVYIPNLELDASALIGQSASWLSSKLGALFAGTAQTFFLFFIAMIGSFYFFRDGRVFTKWLVKISPLPDNEDEVILSRLALAVRSVATGTLTIAAIQGTLTAIGLTLFGFERAILLGAIAAIGALIPSVGTSIVLVPAVIYSVFVGDWFTVIGLTAWGMLAVGLIDNLLGPYLMSRGTKQHPFVTLIAVLGGIALFGPIGFIVGPVIMSLFLVLLELYNQHIVENEVPE